MSRTSQLVSPVVDPDLLTIDEVAMQLRVTRKTLLNWRAMGLGPRGFRVGKSVRYRRSAVTDWVAEQEQADPRGAA